MDTARLIMEAIVQGQNDGYFAERPAPETYETLMQRGVYQRGYTYGVCQRLEELDQCVG